MPLKRIKPDPLAERARVALRAYLKAERGRQQELVRNTGVAQYSISRFVSGRTRRLTDPIRKLCQHAGIDIRAEPRDLGDNIRLRDALARVWDGTEDGARLLAVLIEAMGPLLLAARGGQGQIKPGDQK